MAGLSLNNVLDLNNHCIICFRECDVVNQKDSLEDEDSGNETLNSSGKKRGQNNLCKRFLKLADRYLRLSVAHLDLTVKNDDAAIGIQKFSKRWDKLISGEVCEICKELVELFCDLMVQKDYIEMQLQSVIQGLCQTIHFANMESSCIDAKNLLVSKWKEADSEHFTKLLEILRSQIIIKSDKLKKRPLVVIKRTSNKEIQRITAMNRKKQKPQSMENGRVSVNSSLSLSSHSEKRCSAEQSTNVEKATSNAPLEYKIMRKVFTCKKCALKFFNRDKLKTHYLENHPKPTETLSGPAAHIGNPTSSNAFKMPNTFVCPVKECSEKFWSKKTLIDHKKACHRQLTPSPRPSSSIGQTSSCETAGTVSLPPAMNFDLAHKEPNPVNDNASSFINNTKTGKLHAESLGTAPVNVMRMQEPCTSTFSSANSATSSNRIKQNVMNDSTNQKSTEYPSSNNYTCNICFLACSSSTALQTHLVARHDPNVLFCNKCERGFNGEANLKKHIKFLHPPNKVPPIKPSHKVPSIKPSHKVPSIEPSYKVPSIKPSQKVPSIQSPSSKIKMTLKKCKYCKKYKSMEKFHSHVKSHEIQKNKKSLQQCPYCNRRFRKLKVHMRIHTPSKETSREFVGSNENGTDQCEEEQNVTMDRVILEHEPEENQSNRVNLRQEDRNRSKIDRKSDKSVSIEKHACKRGRKPKDASKTNYPVIVEASENANKDNNDKIKLPVKKRKIVQIVETEKQSDENEQNVQTETVCTKEPEHFSLRNNAPLKKCPPPPPIINDWNIPISSPEEVGNNDSDKEDAGPVSETNIKQESGRDSTKWNGSLESPLKDRYTKWKMVRDNVINEVKACSTTTVSIPCCSKQIWPDVENNDERHTSTSLSSNGSGKTVVKDKKRDVNFAVINERVKSWLSDRQNIQILPTSVKEPIVLDIITLD